ncbi:unnamed protein product [Aphanomyces euteiches]
MQSGTNAATAIGTPTPPQLDVKKLSRFFAEDKPPRKRLAAALEFLKSSNAEQHELFWGEVAHGSMFFSVLHAYLTELETMYVVSERKGIMSQMRTKKFQTDDWIDIFEGLEVLIKSNKALLASGWQHNRFLQIFQKLLLEENLPYIKKYAFRCLALYSDILMDADFGLRNTAQLLGSATNLSSASPGDVNIGFGFSHLDLLSESIDFTPYASGNSNVMLPPRVYTVGSVVGWERGGQATLAEEPVDMLKYVMDLSLERSDNITDVDVQRFLFWCHVIMHSYMPLLYPKTCMDVGFKDKNDKMGFFHHCPGSFQRVMARWLYKLRSKPKFMDALWAHKEYVDVIMETLRQRFAYRDPELVLDGIKFYSHLCKGTQYIPPAMKENFHELHRAIIAHVSQVFHPSVQFDDPNIYIVGVELLDLLSQQPLHVHSFAVLRKAILATTDASFFLRETPPGQSILMPMVATVYHTWIHGMVQPNGSSVDVWIELATMVKKWLTNPSVSAPFALEIIRRWKLEIKSVSSILQWYYTPNGIEKDELPKDISSFMSQQVAPTVDNALLILDRLLHVLSPATIGALRPPYLQAVQESVLEIVTMWTDKAPVLAISPSTIVSLFGEWFLPACETIAPEFEKSQCVALQTLCLVFTVKCNAEVLPMHIALLCRILHGALHDTTRFNILSTILNHASTIFGRSLPGIHILVPVFLHAIDALTEHHTTRLVRYGPEMKKNCLSAVQLLYGIITLPGKYPNLALESWQAKISHIAPGKAQGVPLLAEFDDELHDVAGRCFQRLLAFDASDGTDVQQKALWGLYLLIVLQLQTKPTILVKTYVVLLCDTCASQDPVLSQTALHAIHALHYYHEALHFYEPGLVQHIVLALSLLVQQQVEIASTAIRDNLEKTDSLPRAESPKTPSTPDVRKRANSWSAPEKQSPRRSSSNGDVSRPGTFSEGSDLKTISAKSSAIFEGLTDWVMGCTTLLEDEAVLKLLFQAMEAALIGSIPTQSEWQKVVEAARRKQRKLDTPLLFLGLAMRASLDPDRHKTSLQCFADIAAGAEGFLLHLLHHLHGFPSPAGIDQFVSTCTEFDDKENEGVTSFSFVYLNSIVMTVIGSVDACSARLVARDITGTYTWDAIALSNSMPEPQLAELNAVDVGQEEPWERSKELLNATRERLEVIMDPTVAHANLPTTDMCNICGGRVLKDKNAAAAEKSAGDKGTPSSSSALIPFPVAKKAVLKGNALPSMPLYVFHEEAYPGLGNGNYDIYLCQCNQAPSKQVETSKPAQVPICQLFSIEDNHEYIGSLDNERCLLDLLVDSIPMHYRDCGGDLIDKTLLGGRYTMQKYLDMEWEEFKTNRRVGPMHKDPSTEPGFTFLQRLLHDEECYSYLKTFLVKENGKELIEFCDAIKKFERSFEGNDRLSQANSIFWEYLSSESTFSIKFPYGICSNIQRAIQEAKSHNATLSLLLFQQALDYVEEKCFENGGRLDRFIASLNEAHMKSQQTPTNDANWSNFQIPPQLMLYDAFNVGNSAIIHRLMVMELNVRICAETLLVKKADEALSPREPLPSNSKLVPSRLAPLDMCRLFLGQIGILPNGVLASHYQVHLLDNGVKLERSLKHLDKAPSRETMKIGVVYVGANQSTQQEIFSNTKGSTEYQHFLADLGWEIELATHRGFVGGLDANPKSLSNGTKTIYYSTSTSELIFHVVTMMPTKESDPQQIDKKRHVGNDYVHIVWSDNFRAYNQTTITSNFNFVQVVIYPLKHPSYDGLYLIEILTKPNVPLFGPLMTGMIVSRANLPDLIRQTVMNANRVCRQQTQWYMAPYTTRRKLIEEVVERYATDYSEKSMLTSLFKIPSPSEGHSL